MSKKKGILSLHLEQKKTKSGITWLLRYQDIDGKRYRISGGDKKGRAQALLSQYFSEINSSDAIDARQRGLTYNQFKSEQDLAMQKKQLERRTIVDFFNERLESAKFEKAKKTVKAYQICHRHFIAYIESYNKINKVNITFMEEISLTILEGFQLQLKSKYGFAPASIRQRISIIQCHLTRAQKLGIIVKSPGYQLDRILLEEKEIITYSEDELKRLLNVVQSLDPKWYLYILVALDTGCRPMELQQLAKKKQINFFSSGNIEYGTILIESQANMRTKTKNSRFVVLKNSSVKLLKPYLLSFNDDDVVFKDLDKSNGRKYAQFLKLAGIPIEKSIYTLRRTCLSKLASQNLSPLKLMKLAGHRNIATTLKYYVSMDSIEIAKEVALYDQSLKENKDTDSNSGNTVMEAKAVYAI